MSITTLFYLLTYFSGLIKSLSGKPIYGLYIYIFAFYMYAPGRWWGQSLPNLRWSLTAAMVTLISLFVWKQWKTPWLKCTENKLFLAFVLYVWVQHFWALNTGLQTQAAGLFTKFLLLIYLIHACIRTQKDLVGFIIVNILGCAYFGWIGYTEHTAGRFEKIGTPGIDDGNLLSIHMAPFLIAASYLLLCKFNKKIFLLCIPIVLTLNAILLTQSRGALVAMACAGFASLLFIPKRSKTLFLSFVALAAIAFGSLVGPELLERMNKVTSEEEQIDKSAESRIFIIKAQWEMFKTNPLFGHGHRGTLILSPQYISEEFMTGDGQNRRRGSHNLTMSLLVDHGLIGGGIYLSIFILIGWRLLMQRKRIVNSTEALPIIYLGCVLGLISTIAASQFANSVKLEVDVIFYGVISLAYAWLVGISKPLEETSSESLAPSTKEKSNRNEPKTDLSKDENTTHNDDK